MIYFFVIHSAGINSKWFYFIYFFKFFQCFLVFMEPSKCPMQFKVTVPKNGCMRDLCKGLSGLSDVKSSQMIVTDVYNHKFHKIYKPEDGLHNILDRDDIFV